MNPAEDNGMGSEERAVVKANSAAFHVLHFPGYWHRGDDGCDVGYYGDDSRKMHDCLERWIFFEPKSWERN